MNAFRWILSGLLLASLSGCATLQSEQVVHHVAVIWLKPHADIAVQQRYKEAAEQLRRLPGVIDYSVGARLDVPRTRPNPAVDNSFDLVVSARFADKAAYQAFLSDPEYLKIAQTQLKPLVERYQVYEFSE